MNNIFQFIQNKKGKPIPLKYKLLNNIPLNKNKLIYNGNLDLRLSKLTSLPDNLYINGYLSLYHSEINKLPDKLKIKHFLNINRTKISELPDDLIVNGDLFCLKTPLAERIKNDLSLLNKYSKQVKGRIFYEY